MPVVSLKEFIDDCRHSSLISPQTPRAVITFDDGYRDVWVYAWPILKQFSVTPTCFVCTNPLIRQAPLFYDRLIPTIQSETSPDLILRDLNGSERSFQLRTLQGKELFVKEATRILMGSSQKDQETFLQQFEDHQNGDSPQRATKDLYLSLEEVKKAQAEGVEVGSHTASHPNLQLLPREKWEPEIKGSKEELEAFLGTEMAFFSYPAGQYSPEVSAYVREVGYQGALTTGKKVIYDSIGDRYALPRISPEGIATMGKFYAQVAGIRPDWFK